MPTLCARERIHATRPHNGRDRVVMIHRDPELLALWSLALRRASPAVIALYLRDWPPEYRSPITA